MVAQVIGWENVTSKTPKTSIFQSCHVGLYHADCFLPVACEQMRRCGLGTGKKGRMSESKSNTGGVNGLL